ncbi:MAG: hypothetical protein PF436_09495 [Prolixibacteraceae bacterium]|jgi:hypothetical protein|nr:hypothetical protein [Prolixibacteraceae bacterium]
MDNELNYNNIEDLINNISSNYKILEETIDIELQREFFESSQKIDIKKEERAISELIDDMNMESINNNDKKTIIQKLAMMDSVEAFRALENYSKHAPSELKDWTILALQQSQMILQSSLLDEQQVFISTGLGGKNDKLRYFLIFPFNSPGEVNSIQQTTLEKELKFFMEQYGSDFEEIEFYDDFATTLALIPLKADIQSMIKDLLNECNQYGNFLSDNIIITNIKRFNSEEIQKIIKKSEGHTENGNLKNMK